MEEEIENTPRLRVSSPQIGNMRQNKELLKKISNELIEKTYYNDVKRNLRERCLCKCIGDISEALAHIIAGIGIVLSFAAGFFDLYILSFLAGCFGTVAMILLQCSSYSMKESRERTDEVNILLEKLGINEIPNIAIDSANNI